MSSAGCPIPANTPDSDPEQLAATATDVMPTRERAIRTALDATELPLYPTDSLVVDELGVCQGEFRIDIAVVNSALHGYEIKSDCDTLKRLPKQAAAFSKVFSTMTLVVGTSHLEAATRVVPDWRRILEAAGSDLAVCVRPIREGTRNPAPDPLAIAQLLWRSEAVALLAGFDVPSKLLRRPRWDLWPALVSMMELDALSETVCAALKQRRSWRGGAGGRNTVPSPPEVLQLDGDSIYVPHPPQAFGLDPDSTLKQVMLTPARYHGPPH